MLEQFIPNNDKEVHTLSVEIHDENGTPVSYSMVEKPVIAWLVPYEYTPNFIGPLRTVPIDFKGVSAGNVAPFVYIDGCYRSTQDGSLELDRIQVEQRLMKRVPQGLPRRPTKIRLSSQI
jgi:hypothetical protein